MYLHKTAFKEFPYKHGVRPYRQARNHIDFQIVMNL